VGQPFSINLGAEGRGAKTATVRIYDMLGTKIRERVTTTPITEVIYAQGIFFVSVESAVGKKVFRVVISD
jgi:hypothetical protein